MKTIHYSIVKQFLENILTKSNTFLYFNNTFLSLCCHKLEKRYAYNNFHLNLINFSLTVNI